MCSFSKAKLNLLENFLFKNGKVKIKAAPWFSKKVFSPGILKRAFEVGNTSQIC